MGKKAEFIAVVTGPAQDGCVAECSPKGEDALFRIPFKAEVGTKIKITFEELEDQPGIICENRDRRAEFLAECECGLGVID